MSGRGDWGFSDLPADVDCDGCELCRPAPASVGRVVDIPTWECGFCGEVFDIDDPRVKVGVTSGREYCPNDDRVLTRTSWPVVVGARNRSVR